MSSPHRQQASMPDNDQEDDSTRKRTRVVVVDMTSPTNVANPYKALRPSPPPNPHVDNDDVEVVSPQQQRQQVHSASVSANHNINKDMNDDEEVVVQSSNTTNPNVVYPHLRFDCGIYPFASSSETLFCDLCFCYVCDVKASQCSLWSEHCHATSNDPKWKQQRQESLSPQEEEEEVIEIQQQQHVSAPELSYIARLTGQMLHGRGMMMDRDDDDVQSYYARMGGSLYGRGGGGGEKNKGRLERDMRITEVLAQKLTEAVRLSSSSSSAQTATKESNIQKMEGDIPQLGLHKSFFVEGVRIGWPFPVIMPPQRQMALHLIKALKKKLHVVLESPTGTGKSAAILCAVLAWQRYHGKTCAGKQGEADCEAVPKIIYCSRTHSQVAQMIASLKKTPYRPRMTVLGSRERLCIHREINNREDPSRHPTKGRVNVNQECQTRVKHTEKIRKALWRSHDYHYDDENPPEKFPGDGCGNQGGSQAEGTTSQEAQEGGGDDENISEDAKSGEWILSRSTKKLTCPHYRQLTTTRNAQMARSKFVLDQNSIDCCKVGGEKTRLGVHDIEDLVSFGVNPYVHKDVAVYREGGTGSFGMTLKEHKHGCTVLSTRKDGAAETSGTVKPGDRFLTVNGKKVHDWSLDQITNEVKNSTDPLQLDVLREGTVTADNDDEPYSSHSGCPYYLSKALSKHAELIFCPYNYVLDPNIRKSLDIELENAVVILDEAHNVEDTLKEGGSLKVGEIELCELVAMLADHSSKQRSHASMLEVGGEGGGEAEQKDASEVAHELLLFVEKLVLFMRQTRERFENSPGKEYTGKNGAASAISEYLRFRTPDEKEFEGTFDGPNGHGVRGKAVGCRPFFDRVMITEAQCSKLKEYANALQSHFSGGGQDENRAQVTTLFDHLVDLVSKFSSAMEAPEHFYVACVVQANGSLGFASGEDNGANQTRANRFKKKPRKLPFARPRTPNEPNLPVPVCLHKECRRKDSGNIGFGGGVRHAKFCDGDTPRWEAHLVLKLLSPGLLMKDLSSQCRTVVLASGSLAPLPSLCGELDLHPPKESAIEVAAASNKSSGAEASGRLQVHPKPLEASHVIDLQKQLFAVGIGHFPDGTPLTVSYSHYKNLDFFPRLGNAIASVIEGIPRGGVLVFFPSYSFLRKCIKCWNPEMDSWESEHTCPEIWERFIQSKGKVVVEPTGSQQKFEAAKEEYSRKIRMDGNCILLAVFRGKMSEGISFNDDNARGVICVGLPFPNAFDQSIKAKKAYNDEQRKLRNRKSLLPGSEWYSQQAYRAIAQALGRCIRHAADYGTVVLMDSRHCDDGAPVDGICRAHRNLPKWMRHHVRTLSMGNTMHGRYGGGNQVSGGYPGLATELRSFFADAPKHSQIVLDKGRSDLAGAQARERQSSGHSFNSKTGKWTQTSSAGLKSCNPAAYSPFFNVTQDSPAAAGQVGSVQASTPQAILQKSGIVETPLTTPLATITRPVSSSPTTLHHMASGPQPKRMIQDENTPENVCIKPAAEGPGNQKL